MFRLFEAFGDLEARALSRWMGKERGRRTAGGVAFLGACGSGASFSVEGMGSGRWLGRGRGSGGYAIWRERGDYLTYCTVSKYAGTARREGEGTYANDTLGATNTSKFSLTRPRSRAVRLLEL